MSADGETGAVSDDARRSRLLPLVVVVLGVVTIAAVTWGLAQKRDADDVRDATEERRAAVLVATGFVEALLGYDYDDLDSQQAAVEQFSTDAFRADYVDAFTNEVRDQIVAEEARATVEVEEVWLTLDDDDDLTVIVHARSSVESGAGATAELESYLRIRLVRLEGGWKVDDLTSLASRDVSAPLPSTEPENDADG